MPINLVSWSIRLLLVVFCLMPTGVKSSTIQQTQSELNKLNTKISTLKQALLNAQDRHGLLNRELQDNEKQISSGIRKLQHMQEQMNDKKRNVAKMEQNIAELNKQLATQQNLLAKHIRVRYKMGEYQPIKWIVKKDTLYDVNQLLTFHQYLVQARQRIIANIDATKKTMMQNQATMEKDLSDLRGLESGLHAKQEQLEHSKIYHKAVIDTLHQEIKNKEQVLSEFERNKLSLSKILTTLSSQSLSRNGNSLIKQSFLSMRHKLPRPVRTVGPLHKANQGLTFLAREGTPVYAVFPGKIVFSNWLNGYGLLIIIDHGQGFMTLYAHNQALLKHKGENVTQGEQIATLGHSGGIHKNELYFEVRRGGKVISPTDWLA